MTTPWFVVNGASPEIRPLSFFRCSLTAEQVRAFMEIEEQGRLIRGYYTSWEHFCDVHNIVPMSHLK